MPTFNDKVGHDWAIRFDGILLSELRDAHSIDLSDIGGESYLKIETDQIALTKVAIFLCREQAAKEGVSDVQFRNNFCGEVAEDAMAAIWGAAKNFFRPKLWSALQSAFELRKRNQELLAILSPLMEMASTQALPKEMREAVMELLTAAMTKLSGNSQQSAANLFAFGQDAVRSKPATESQEPAEFTHAG